MDKVYNVKGDRLLVTSRGTYTPKEDEVAIPDMYVRDSNICSDDDGNVVITRDFKYFDLGNKKRIVNKKDIIAEIIDDEVIPVNGWVLVRKCLDDNSEAIVTSLSQNKSRFAEILDASADSVIKDYIGWLAHVDDTTDTPQKVEETEADWLVKQEAIQMVVKTED